MPYSALRNFREIFYKEVWLEGVLEGIQDLDVIAKGHGLVAEERMRKEDMSKELDKTILQEEVSWR